MRLRKISEDKVVQESNFLIGIINNQDFKPDRTFKTVFYYYLQTYSMLIKAIH